MIDLLRSLKNFLRDKKEALWDKKNLFSFFQQTQPKTENYNQINEGILEIIYNDGSHCANALLLNKNGLFVTCNHCVEIGYQKLHLRKLNGDVYEIIGIIATDEKKDIALGMASTHLGPEKMRYKIFTPTEEHRDKDIKIALLSLREGSLTVKDGTTLLSTRRVIIKKTINDRFVKAKLSCLPGDSGGVFIDSNLGIIGIQSNSSKNRDLSYMIPWKKVDRFISKFV